MALFVGHIMLEIFLGLGFKQTLELRKLCCQEDTPRKKNWTREMESFCRII
jgi:hypothetical protein